MRWYTYSVVALFMCVHSMRSADRLCKISKDTLDAVSQSLAMGMVNRKIVAPALKRIQTSDLGSEPARQLYQNLVKEAQEKVVPERRRRVGAIRMNDTCLLSGVAAAFSTPIGIFVNEKKVDQRTYGAQRALLFHESVHTQYRDLAMFTSIGAASFITSALVLNALFTSTTGILDARIIGLSLVLAGCIAKHTVERYQHYMERRADVQGHKATECADCVRASGQQRYETFQVEGNPLNDSGYLHYDELYKMADEMKGQQCTWHQQHQEPLD